MTTNRMQTRLLTKQERPLAAALWTYCFGDTAAFTAWYFDRRAGEILAILDNGDLVAQAVCVPMVIATRDKPTPAVMLSGIATAPAYRRQGYMNSLTPALFQHLREKAIATAVLYPFDYGYYRRFGFAHCGEVAKVDAAFSALPDGKPQGQIVPLRGDAEDLATLVQVYENCFSRYSGRSLRDEAAFAGVLEENALFSGYAAVYRRDKRLEGYLIYHMHDKIMHVSEIGACSQPAREDLLSFLKDHASSMHKVHFTCPLDDPLWRMLTEPRGNVSVEPHDMLRIIDVEAALEGLPAGDAAVTLRIQDDFAPWNAGVWQFSGKGGVFSAKKLEAAPAHANDADGSAPIPTLSIGELTQWAFGHLDGSGLLRVGASIDQDSALAMDQLLPSQPFFLYEMY